MGWWGYFFILTPTADPKGRDEGRSPARSRRSASARPSASRRLGDGHGDGSVMSSVAGSVLAVLLGCWLLAAWSCCCRLLGCAAWLLPVAGAPPRVARLPASLPRLARATQMPRLPRLPPLPPRLHGHCQEAASGSGFAHIALRSLQTRSDTVIKTCWHIAFRFVSES